MHPDAGLHVDKASAVDCKACRRTGRGLADKIRTGGQTYLGFVLRGYAGVVAAAAAVVVVGPL